MGRRTQHRKDANHVELVQGMARAGWGWLDLSQTDASIDGIAVKGGRLVPVEIKDGSLPPSGRKLTEKEAKRHAWFKAHGIEVLLFTSLSDLAQLDRQARDRYEE